MPRVRSGSVCATLSAIRIQSESRSRRTFVPARARTMRSTHAFRPAAQNGLDADLSDTDLLQDPLGVSTSAAKASAPSREAEFDVDLVVIRRGSGGIRAPRVAAGHGAKVMLAEEYRLGGTCVIRGCVPKKLLVYASHIHHEIGDAAGFGWTIPSATFDWPTLIANKDKEIARLEAAYTANVEKSGARIVKTRAAFEDPHTLRLATGEAVRARYVLIATGGAPNHGLAIPGIEHVISSNEVFHLNALPKRIVLQGGG